MAVSPATELVRPAIPVRPATVVVILIVIQDVTIVRLVTELVKDVTPVSLVTELVKVGRAARYVSASATPIIQPVRPQILRLLKICNLSHRIQARFPSPCSYTG